MRFFSQTFSYALALAATVSAGVSRHDSALPQAEVTELATLGAAPAWAENLAFRPNGNLLVTHFYSAALYHVDTVSGKVAEIFAFNTSESIGVLGIGGDSPATQDVFFLAVAALLNTKTYTKVAGINSIYRVDMRPFRTAPHNASEVLHPAVVTRVAVIDDALLFNGLAVLADGRHLLVADSLGGVVYGIDTATGAYTVAVNNSMMSTTYAAVPLSGLGINGLRIHKSLLYWSNSAASLVARIPIDPVYGSPTGTAEIVVSDVEHIDDFTIRDSDGTLFLCQNQIDIVSVAYVGLSSKPATAPPIAGSNISTVLAGVTSAQFAPSHPKRLYLTTSGGVGAPINGSIIVGGGVSYIDTSTY